MFRDWTLAELLRMMCGVCDVSCMSALWPQGVDVNMSRLSPWVLRERT